ncbi:SprT-like domain-containing protein [Haladaptatus pallidirubidus]|uniref:SprT-like domain-containing protein n=1 Tax=Haladaptatus pallidirubidus TaxID=1008152 RepID=UPI001D119C7C|nr:SprT-like domain-containing protein [Haladaptatus pallidirubidus]
MPVDALEWDVSHRAKRQTDVTKYDPATDEITISLTWDTYDSHGWEQFSSTVRHELIHAWQYHEVNEADHGQTFTRWTDALDTTQLL